MTTARGMTDRFGDFEPADAFDADDDTVDWTHIDELDRQIIRIDAIVDPVTRLVAARKWAAELSGRR